MRGIPREVVKQKLSIQGTKFRAQDIADTTNICIWNQQNYGIDMDKPGAQEFYNSLVNQMASCGVDLIKYDDIVPYPKEVEAVSKAISQCGRHMVLSLSPGGDVPEYAINFFKKGNMLRVTHDIWDDQLGIDQCFAAWRKWQGKEEPGFWIDMDMIPLGQLKMMSPKPENLSGNDSKKEIEQLKTSGKLSNVELLAGKGWQRQSQFTTDQMYTFITMRALAASPLMVGGDLPTMDDFSLSLLTNPEMLACNQNGIMGKLIFEKDKVEIWKTFQKNTKNGWIGIFNRSETEKSLQLTSEILEIQNGNSYLVKNIWENKIIEQNTELDIAPNGVAFIRFVKEEKL